MKKWLAATLILCLFLSACGKKEDAQIPTGEGKTVGVCPVRKVEEIGLCRGVLGHGPAFFALFCQ